MKPETKLRLTESATAKKKALRAHAARRGRLGEKQYRALVLNLARVILLAFRQGAVASPLGLEGPFRSAIRSDLCLQFWAWRQADAMACEAIADAFRFLGAERPTWQEGQQEWTLGVGNMVERSVCVRCYKPLPEGHRKFCSSLCKSVHADRMMRLRRASEDTAIKMAINVA